MEGALRPRLSARSCIVLLGLWLGLSFPVGGEGQEMPGSREEAGQLRLQKSVKTRKFQGRPVEGEERVVGPKETLWRILVREKGLPQKNFGRYLILIGSLNPHLKDPNVLLKGSTVFIPIRPDEILGIQVAAGQTRPKIYRVKVGDHLYQILREQLGAQEQKELEAGLGEVRRLNPRKKDWDRLLVGETIALPEFSRSPEGAPEVLPERAAEPVGLDYGRKLPAQENLQLLEQVLNALGSEMNRKGEEVLPVQEGIVHMDRSAYPIVVSRKKEQKVILDIGGKIPASLKTRLEGRGSLVPVVSLKPNASLHEAVDSLIAYLGFQPVPVHRPIMVQEQGVGVQLKGEWVVALPEESGGKQTIWIVNLSDGSEKTPDYLQEYLLLRGMNLKEVFLPASSHSPASLLQTAQKTGTERGIEAWPREKKALVDAFLRSYPVSFSIDRPIVLSLREGIRMDIKMDRYLELGGKKFAVFFGPIGEEAKKALEEKEATKAVELDLESLTLRDLISRLAAGLGENAPYQEHRFPAVEGRSRDKVVLTVTGFFFPPRSLLLTDKEIPRDLHRFFFDRGHRIVYF